MKTVEEYTQEITALLKEAGRWNEGLKIQVKGLASALRSLDLINKDLDAIESTTIETPQGMKAHPVFHIRKETEDSVTRQAKALGLTAADFIDEVSEDPMHEATEALISSMKKAKPTKLRE